MPRHRFDTADIAAKERELRARIAGAPPTREQLDAADNTIFNRAALVIFGLACDLLVLHAAWGLWEVP